MTTKRKVTVEDVLPLFGSNRLEGNTSSRQLSTVAGTAVGNSDGGLVKVVVGDGAITDGDSGAVVEIPTSVKVEDGDTVVITNNGNGIIGSPLVTDVIGGGDRTYDAISGAETAAQAAQEAAEAAQRAAEEAAASGGASGQYFFDDDNGVHVSTVPGDATEGPNLLANSQGIMLRDGDNVLSAQTPSGFAIYDGSGNAATNITGLFSDIVTLGKRFRQQMVIDTGGIDIIKERVEASMNLASEDVAVVLDDGVPVTLGEDDGPVLLTHIGQDYQSFTGNTSLINSGIITPGYILYSYADGDHGQFSFSAGANNYATGRGSTAFGISNDASGDHSLVAGNHNEAASDSSVALGSHSKANAPNQLVIGEYNALDTQQALIIGNGTGNDNRSNAFQVSKNGSVQAAGTLSAADASIGTGTQVVDGKGQTAVGHYNTNADDTLFVVGNGTSDTARSNAMRVTAAGNVGISGNLNAGGTILDQVKQGTGTLTTAGTSGTCKWVKSGHVVQVYFNIKVRNALSTYSALNNCFTGLPKAIITAESAPVKIDGSTATCFATVSAAGALGLIARETALAAGNVVLGAFTYISSE